MKAQAALRKAGVAACASALLFIASCSDASDGGGTDNAGSAQASEQATAASAMVAQAKKVPTAMSLTTPLDAPPSKGKKLVWLNCDFALCSIIGDGIETGIAAGGWQFDQVNYSSADPATLTAAFRRALDMNPTAVAVSGVPPTAGWQSVLPEYEKRGIPIIASFLGPTELNSTIITNVGGPPDHVNTGQIVARWFIADSNGHGNAILQTVDGFPIIKTFTDAFADTVAAECAECEVTRLANTIDQASSGKIVPSIVPALTKSPDTKYLIASSLEFLDSLPAALSAAGLQDVKVAGQTPTEAGQANLKAGKFTAATTQGSYYAGWLIADTAYRHDAGLPLPEATNGPMPTRLLTTDSELEISASQDYPTDYQDQFKTLWKVN